MQYQKDIVRQKILDAALEEFDRHGYDGAQIRRIAQKAGVATGNIYRYFRNKEDIFETIVQSVYVYISRIIMDLYKDSWGTAEIRTVVRGVAGSTMDIYRRFGRELMVIADKSKGSRYEHFTRTLAELVSRRLHAELAEHEGAAAGNGFSRDVLIHIIASGFVEGLFTILRTCRDPALIEHQFNRLLFYFFDDIRARLHPPAEAPP